MEAPITNPDLQTALVVIAPSKTEPTKKPSATNQQMKAAYIMVLVALMDSLKTSTQTAQVQAKEQNLAINVQQSLVNQMQAVKSIEFRSGEVFSKDHYWKVVYYTLSGWNNHHWHTIYTRNPVSRKWLENRGGSHYVGPTIKQNQIARYVWVEKKEGAGSLEKVQMKIELSNETRTIIEGKINIGQQKSMIVSAGINMTVQGLQQLIAEIGTVSHQLSAFSNRIASI